MGKEEEKDDTWGPYVRDSREIDRVFGYVQIRLHVGPKLLDTYKMAYFKLKKNCNGRFPI